MIACGLRHITELMGEESGGDRVWPTSHHRADGEESGGDRVWPTSHQRADGGRERR